MSSAQMPTASVDSGSFRDRDGRIYLHGKRVFRGLSKSALESYRQVSETAFYRKFSESGDLVKTTGVDQSSNPLPESLQ